MTGISRKKAITVGDAIKEMFVKEHLSASHNTRRIFAAWDDASGARNFTSKRFFRDGILYITLTSSVIRMQLSVQKDLILARMNAILEGDPLFIRSGSEGPVKEIKLK